MVLLGKSGAAVKRLSDIYGQQVDSKSKDAPKMVQWILYTPSRRVEEYKSIRTVEERIDEPADKSRITTEQLNNEEEPQTTWLLVRRLIHMGDFVWQKSGCTQKES